MYYKDVLLDACPLTSAPADCEELGPNLFRVRPPVAVPCDQAEKWRNSRCSTYNGAGEEALPEMGVERDWLQFLRAWNQGGADATANGNLTEMLAVYRQVCNPGACMTNGVRDLSCVTPPCAGQRFTWAPQADRVGPGGTVLVTSSYRDGTRAYYDGLRLAGDAEAALRLAHFNQSAFERGVDDNVQP